MAWYKALGSALLSAVFFYMATVLVKIGSKAEPSFFVAGRFLVGFCAILPWYLYSVRRRLGESQVGLWDHIKSRLAFTHVWLRAITNFIAVWLFFEGIARTTAAEANLLNMTYPVFVALSGLFWISGWKPRLEAIGQAILCFVGIWLVVSPNPGTFSHGQGTDSLYALGSGIIAAWSILLLNRSRQVTDSLSILWAVFLTGAVSSIILWPEQLGQTDAELWGWNIGASVLGTLGQFFLTWSFKSLSPVEGSILSSSRILLAGFLGPFVFSCESWSPGLLLGTGLLFGANVWIALRRNSKPRIS